MYVRMCQQHLFAVLHYKGVCVCDGSVSTTNCQQRRLQIHYEAWMTKPSGSYQWATVYLSHLNVLYCWTKNRNIAPRDVQEKSNTSGNLEKRPQWRPQKKNQFYTKLCQNKMCPVTSKLKVLHNSGLIYLSHTLHWRLTQTKHPKTVITCCTTEKLKIRLCRLQATTLTHKVSYLKKQVLIHNWISLPCITAFHINLKSSR